jgi:arylsulfatase A-like enzyme
MKFVRNPLFIFLALVVAVVGTYYFINRSSKDRHSDRMNVILLSLDTLRSDRLGTHGYTRTTSPFLDSLAARSTMFEHAVTPAPWTLPAHVSLLTGMYPSAHGVSLSKGQSIGPETHLLAELMQQNGYRTFGYVAGGYLGKRFGFPRGFETYYVNSAERDQETQGFQKVLKLAREKLLSIQSQPSPFFMFLHTYTVHCPYSPPEPYASMFNSEGAEEVNPHYCGKKYNKLPGFNKNNALYLSDRYDGSVRFLDTLLKDFFGQLEHDGILDNTMIVIVSDHGDEFYEHGRIGHGESLHRELLMVPLIVHGPGFAHRRVSEPVSLVDVFPTILDATGIKVAEQNQGRSLLDLLKGGKELPPRLQFSELDYDALLRSLINPLSDHYILDLESDKAKFYDLVSDWPEVNNLADSIPDQLADRKAELKKLTQGMKRHSAGSVDSTTQEHLEQLKTLGYL